MKKTRARRNKSDAPALTGVNYGTIVSTTIKGLVRIGFKQFEKAIRRIPAPAKTMATKRDSGSSARTARFDDGVRTDGRTAGGSI